MDVLSLLGFESQRSSLNSAAAFEVISFLHLGSGELIYSCVFLTVVSWVLDVCLSEPRACLSTAHHSLCLSLGTS